MELFLLFFTIFIGLILFSVAWTSISLAPFVATRNRDLKRIFELAGLKTGEVFYDLGCGNGRVAIYAARNFSAKAIGIEAAWPFWFLCKLREWFIQNKNLEFKMGNLFREDLSSADVIYFFGMPDSIRKRLKVKLEKELKPGARVISYVFNVPGWEAEKVSKPNQKDVTIYLYQR